MRIFLVPSRHWAQAKKSAQRQGLALSLAVADSAYNSPGQGACMHSASAQKEMRPISVSSLWVRDSHLRGKLLLRLGCDRISGNSPSSNSSDSTRTRTFWRHYPCPYSFQCRSHGNGIALATVR